MKTRLKKGEDLVSTFSYPTWEQLPELDLYLDQVLLYVNKTCAPVLSSSDKGLTAAMINNYVKHGYVEKPDKKKYQRRQVARLIAITTLKTVFSIQEIASTLNFLQDQASSDLLYNSFVAYLNEQKEPIAPIIRSACQTIQLYLETLSYIQPVKTEEETDELHHETK